MNIRKWMIPSVAVSFALIGWASGFVFADKGEQQKLLEQLNLPKDYYAQAVRTIDMNLDGTMDKVILFGQKEKPDDWYVTNLNIAVIDGKTKAVRKSLLKEFGGYEPVIEAIGDFTADQKPEVFISAGTGGSGGYSSYAILDMSANEPQNIFDESISEGLKISGHYEDGFKANIRLENSGESFTVDLSKKKQNYMEDKVYDASGKFIGNLPDKDGSVYDYTISGYPFSSLEAVDWDGDGKLELMGSQRLIGVNNVERLSNVDSVLTYDDKKWTMMEASYRTYLK